ncbi:Myb/SANT-like DNA-binding domain [Popillia japonica]|uniref:Regulatory protein zeste n=1 Tax=Popillia japonica TaxID=7064 RepID=A0AAW1KHL9_POPJA
MLIEFLEKEKDLISGKFSTTFTFKEAQRRGENIAEILNAIPGASKDWKQWRKTWQDIRCKTKHKQAQFRKNTRATGGGPPPQDKLTVMEEKVVSIISPYSVVGCEDIIESDVKFDFESSTAEKKRLLYNTLRPTKTTKQL